MSSNQEWRSYVCQRSKLYVLWDKEWPDYHTIHIVNRRFESFVTACGDVTVVLNELIHTNAYLLYIGHYEQHFPSANLPHLTQLIRSITHWTGPLHQSIPYFQAHYSFAKSLVTSNSRSWHSKKTKGCALVGFSYHWKSKTGVQTPPCIQLHSRAPSTRSP